MKKAFYHSIKDTVSIVIVASIVFGLNFDSNLIKAAAFAVVVVTIANYVLDRVLK